jgi:hypothetical protein
MSMTWEAFRLTSKSPSELLHTLGPHGVDHLIRQALDAVWREYPEETRTFENVRRRAQEVFDRNYRHWMKIKKPTPQAFFDNLLPYNADGFIRQAMVLSWMMLPRAGGRKFSDTKQIIRALWYRNIDCWNQDYRNFSTPAAATKKSKSSKPKKSPKKPAAKRKK